MLQNILGRLGLRREITVGVVACCTGPLAAYGTRSLQGFELGLEYATGGSRAVTGRPIRLVVEDDAGDPDTASHKAGKLIAQEGVHILQGCTTSSTSIKIARLAQEHKRVFLVAVAATDVLTGEWFNRYVFRTASTTSQDAAAGGKYAVENLGRNFCFLSPDNVWGQESRAAWWRVVEEHGGKIVNDLIVPSDKTDFRPRLREVLAQPPDVFVPFWAGSATKDLLVQTREVGIFDSSKVAGNLVDQETVQAVGEAITGLICAVKYHYTFSRNPVNDWFVQHYQARYNAPPDLFNESGFTAGIALVEALKRTGADTGAEALVPIMEGMSFESPKGACTFRSEDHQALQPMYVAEMVKHPQQPYCTPRLIREVSAAESTPPLIKPREAGQA